MTKEKRKYNIVKSIKNKLVSFFRKLDLFVSDMMLGVDRHLVNQPETKVKATNRTINAGMGKNNEKEKSGPAKTQEIYEKAFKSLNGIIDNAAELANESQKDRDNGNIRAADAKAALSLEAYGRAAGTAGEALKHLNDLQGVAPDQVMAFIMDGFTSLADRAIEGVQNIKDIGVGEKAAAALKKVDRKMSVLDKEIDKAMGMDDASKAAFEALVKDVTGKLPVGASQTLASEGVRNATGKDKARVSDLNKENSLGNSRS